MTFLGNGQKIAEFCYTLFHVLVRTCGSCQVIFSTGCVKRNVLPVFAFNPSRNTLRIISGHALCKCGPIRGRLSNLRRGSPSNEEKTSTIRVSRSEGILKLQLGAETDTEGSYRPALN